MQYLQVLSILDFGAMRHALFLGFLLACVAAPAQSQVCSGGLVLESQAEVDTFACSEVIGDLVIRGPSITDLTPLASLTLLDGSLTIASNTLLTSLAGLENLDYMEGRDITIENNAALVSIAALGGLATVDISGVEIRDNPVLASLAGLEAITQADRCVVVNNDALVTLAGLDGLASAGRVSVNDNASLASLAGLDNLAVVGWNLRIERNAALTSLEGLGQLTSVGFGLFTPGDLRIVGNTSLASLAGLEQLTSVGQDLLISENPALTSLEGLAQLSYVEEDFRLLNNDALTTLDGLENLTLVVIELLIRGNDALDECSCGLSGLISGDPPEFTGSLGQTLITGNKAGGACTSPATVLVNPCTPQGPLDLVAQVADLNPVVSAGGDLPFVYTVTNSSGDPFTGDLWFTASPGGFSGRIVSGTVLPGQRISGSYRQDVLATTAPGDYDYTLVVGQFPSAVEDSVPFTVTVTGSARATSIVEAWSVTDATPWASEPVVEASSSLPEGFALEAAHPNPFTSATAVAFALPDASDVRLTVHDVLGREVAVLVEGEVEAGRHTAQFEASGLASGVYLVRLTAGPFSAMQRVTLAR